MGTVCTKKQLPTLSLKQRETRGDNIDITVNKPRNNAVTAPVTPLDSTGTLFVSGNDVIITSLTQSLS